MVLIITPFIKYYEQLIGNDDQPITNLIPH